IGQDVKHERFKLDEVTRTMQFTALRVKRKVAKDIEHRSGPPTMPWIAWRDVVVFYLLKRQDITEPMVYLHLILDFLWTAQRTVTFVYLSDIIVTITTGHPRTGPSMLPTLIEARDLAPIVGTNTLRHFHAPWLGNWHDIC